MRLQLFSKCIPKHNGYDKEMSLWHLKNDSRYFNSWVRNANGDLVKFFHFPGAVRQKERRQRWRRLCHRGDSFVCTKDSYVCSLHFVGGNGPTEEDPDPISAVASKERVS